MKENTSLKLDAYFMMVQTCKLFCLSNIFQVLSMATFEHLGFLVQFGDKVSDVSPLSQATPFFANSDPDMPAVPVPASQVHDWLLQNIATALESITERISGKENSPSNASDQDDAMSDVCAAPNKVAPSTRGPCLIEGVSKASLVKQASDLRGRSVKVCCEQLTCVSNIVRIFLAPFFLPVILSLFTHVNSMFCVFCVFCRLSIVMIL